MDDNTAGHICGQYNVEHGDDGDQDHGHSVVSGHHAVVCDTDTGHSADHTLVSHMGDQTWDDNHSC